MLWIWKAYICLHEALYNQLIDGVRFCVSSVVPRATVSRHRRTQVILSRLHCTMYTNNMAAATVNIDDAIANDS